MQAIKEHIKANQYKPVYLLYGAEDYLKHLYRDKLKAGILGEGDAMNYSCFKDKDAQESAVIEIAETMPFFAEHRLIVIENSGWFKNQSGFADYIREMPVTTHIVFVENEVDKRSRSYKAVKEVGTISEMTAMDEKNLKLWIASRLDADHKKITGKTVQFLIQKCGSDMETLSNELEKLVCYAYDRQAITDQDVEEVCTTRITGKIFQMIDAIGYGRQAEAMNLYYDLLALREKPMTILYLIARHFNILLEVKELRQSGEQNSAIASKVGIPPFAVNKYCQQTEHFTKGKLLEALGACTNTEELVKTGRMGDQLGVELLLVEFSRR